MADAHCFLSTLPTRECALRLERLTAQSTYEVGLGKRILRITIEGLHLTLLSNGSIPSASRSWGGSVAVAIPFEALDRSCSPEPAARLVVIYDGRPKLSLGSLRFHVRRRREPGPHS